MEATLTTTFVREAPIGLFVGRRVFLEWINELIVKELVDSLHASSTYSESVLTKSQIGKARYNLNETP